jgi:hypothetical protein
MVDITWQLMYLSAMAVFIAGIFWGTLRLMDLTVGLKFSEAIERFADNPLALAIYFGARIVALAILFSPLLRVIL